MSEFNIAPNTQIGRIEIDKQVYDNENVYGLDKYSRGGEFIENMVSDNIIEFCKRWFGLAGCMEFIEDMKEYEQLHYQYSAPYHRFKNLEAGLKESAIYDLPNKVERAIVDLYETPKAITLLGNLKQNNLSNDFERICADCISIEEGPNEP